MKTLSKQDILAADDRKTEIVDVPEWGGSVTVRVMSGKQRDQYQMSMVARDADGKALPADLSNLTARLVAMTVVDENGAPMFTIDDVRGLGEKNGEALQRVGDVAARINGLTSKAVQEAEKNSAPVPSGDSTSA